MSNTIFEIKIVREDWMLADEVLEKSGFLGWFHVDSCDYLESENLHVYYDEKNRSVTVHPDGSTTYQP